MVLLSSADTKPLSGFWTTVGRAVSTATERRPEVLRTSSGRGAFEVLPPSSLPAELSRLSDRSGLTSPPSELPSLLGELAGLPARAAGAGFGAEEGREGRDEVLCGASLGDGLGEGAVLLTVLTSKPLRD